MFSNTKNEDTFKDDKGRLYISPQDMGFVVCEISNTRYKNIMKLFKENEIEADPQLLDMYTYAYNFYFIKKTLLRKYNSDIVDIVMDTALAVYQRLTEKINDTEDIKLTIHSTYSALDGVMEEDADALFFVRCFLADIGKSNSFSMSKYDAEFLYTAIELTSWLDNDYILTEYEINPYTKQKLYLSDNCSERQCTSTFSETRKQTTFDKENQTLKATIEYASNKDNDKAVSLNGETKIGITILIIIILAIFGICINYNGPPKHVSGTRSEKEVSNFEYVCDTDKNIIHKKKCSDAYLISKGDKIYANQDTAAMLTRGADSYKYCEYCCDDMSTE